MSGSQRKGEGEGSGCPAAADERNLAGHERSCSAQVGAQAVDLAVIAALLRGVGDRAQAAEENLIITFLGELPRVTSRLRKGLEDGDKELLHRSAHTLKSSSATMGALRLSQLCTDLEDRSGASIPPDGSAATAAVIDECDRVEAALLRRLQQLRT